MYNWIDTTAMPGPARLPDSAPLLLWGAGEGTRQALCWLAERGQTPRVLGIVDNNPTRQGETFCTHPVVAPARLSKLRREHPGLLVLVTTVSGREAVGAQLDAMGLCPGHDYLQVGTYPLTTPGRLRTLLTAHAAHTVLRPAGGRPARVVHVGPGGFLGMEAALVALGCTVTSVDAFGFNLAYPELGRQAADYAELGRQLPGIATEFGWDTREVASRYRALFSDDFSRLQTDAIDYRHPHRFGELPVANGSMDLICSFAVLEHVRRPAKAARECVRVLSPGGYSLHNILSYDHRSFNPEANLSPIDYLRYAPDEWEAAIRDTFPQNRVLPAHWRRHFGAAGLAEVDYRCLRFHMVDEAERARLHPDWRDLPGTVLGEVECEILSQKVW